MINSIDQRVMGNGMHACLPYSKQTCKSSAGDLAESIVTEHLDTKDSVYWPCEISIHTEEHHNQLDEKTNKRVQQCSFTHIWKRLV